MKNTKWISAVALLLAVVALLTSCGAPALRYDSEAQGYVRESDGAVFLRAGKNYAAVGIDREQAIAEIVQEGDDVLLYPVCGPTTDMDPNVWMASEDYTLYYAKGTALPTLGEMQINEVRILQNTSNSFVMAYITKAEEVNALVDTCESGSAFSHKDIQNALVMSTYTQYQLAFASQSYAGIYYMLVYYRFDDEVILTERIDGVTSLGEDFVPTYDAPYTVTEEDGHLTVRYNLGKNIVFDRALGQCYAVRDVFESHFDRAE